MKNFSKFCYGVRAFAVGTLCLTVTYSELEKAGVIDKAKTKVNNIKRKIELNKLQKVINKVEEPKSNLIIEEAIKNTYYSECFRNRGAN